MPILPCEVDERASLLLMPSRSEGFGLASFEAIDAGVPVLITEHCGLAELLVCLGEDGKACTVPVTDDLAVDAHEWARAIAGVLADLDEANNRAQRVRDGLADRCSWPASVSRLLEALDLSENRCPTDRERAVVRRHSNLPPRNPIFTGRRDELATVQAALAEASRRPVILTGLGGCGKSQVAIEAAHRQASDHEVTWLVRAEPPASRTADLAALAEALEIAESDLPEPEAACAAVAWLADKGGLVIFDSAAEPSSIPDALCGSSAASVLITSQRAGGWNQTGQALTLGPWNRAESVRHIVQLGGDPDQSAAAELAQRLGDLPLAIDQAAAYIDTMSTTTRGYLSRLQDHASDLLAAGEPPSGYAFTVDSVWSVAHESLIENPEAFHVLCGCAFVDPDQIPLELLAGLLDLDPDQDVLELDKILLGLARFSLLSGRDTDFSVHRLVQEVTRYRLGEDAAHWCLHSGQTLNVLLGDEPTEPEQFAVYERLQSHVVAVVEHLKSLGVEPTLAASLLRRVAVYRRSRGSVAEAARLLCQARALLNEEDEDLAGLLREEAVTRVELREIPAAAQLSAEAERLSRRAEFDPRLRARILDAVGITHLEQGREEEAETAQRGAVDMLWAGSRFSPQIRSPEFPTPDWA